MPLRLTVYDHLTISKISSELVSELGYKLEVDLTADKFWELRQLVESAIRTSYETALEDYGLENNH